MWVVADHFLHHSPHCLGLCAQCQLDNLADAGFDSQPPELGDLLGARMLAGRKFAVALFVDLRLLFALNHTKASCTEQKDS